MLADQIIFDLVRFWVLARYADQYQKHFKWIQQAGRQPRPVRPVCIDDKYFWRKIFDHNPVFTIISDKLAVKTWIIQEGIQVKTARVLWSGQDANQIPPEVLSGNVVVKANHGWNMNIIIRNGEYDRAELVQEANDFLAHDHGSINLEWGYLNVPPRLFVEELLGDDQQPVFEMKFYTFGTRIERLIMIYDRQGEIAADVWMPDQKGGLYLTDEQASVSANTRKLPLPPSAPRAIAIAKDIGSRFDHMRVDLFSDGDQIWLNELTVYNLGGHIPKYGVTPDVPINAAWDLRDSWFLNTPQGGWRKIYAAALRRWLDSAGHPPTC